MQGTSLFGKKVHKIVITQSQKIGKEILERN
jgi:hypothetical protein